MTKIQLFKKHLKQAIKEGLDHEDVNLLAGCTDRKIVLTAAEAEAGKRTYRDFMDKRLWHDPEFDTDPGWLFGSEKTGVNIGLVPLPLAKDRLGLNRQNWAGYSKVY